MMIGEAIDIAGDLARGDADTGVKCPSINRRCSKNMGAWKIGLPVGSSNSTQDGRINMAAFLRLGGICPVGYEPNSRNYFPHLPDAPNIEFVALRPQDMSVLTASARLDAFLAVEDVVAEAQEAGVRGIKKLLELPFAKVDLVMVVKHEAQYSTLEGLLSRVRAPIRCVSELPFLTRSCFLEETVYKERFNDRPPLIERYPRNIVDRCYPITITESAGSSEPQVRASFYHCGVMLKSIGRTIEECRLKVIKVIGTFHPGFFCRAGLRDDVTLRWFTNRLKLAQRKWAEMQRYQHLELAFADA